MCASVGAVLGRPSTSAAGSVSHLFFLGALGVLAVPLLHRPSADPQLRRPVSISSFLSWRPWRLGGSSYAPALGRPSTSLAGSVSHLFFLGVLGVLAVPLIGPAMLLGNFLEIPFQQTKAVAENSSNGAAFPPPNQPPRPLRSLRESSPSGTSNLPLGLHEVSDKR
jgi:hypothetical protein